MALGVVFGLACSLMLKHSRLNEYPEIESCLIILIAYTSYFFSNGLTMSGAYESASNSFAKLILYPRHRIAAVLRYHSQALCVPQHVEALSKNEQVHLCKSRANLRKLYLHLPWTQSIHSNGLGLQAPLHCRYLREHRIDIRE